MSNQNDKKNEKNGLDDFLNDQPATTGENLEMDCSSGVCIIKGDKSIVEKINKKIITEDGRQLLI